MAEISSPPACQTMVMKVYESIINHTIDSCYNLYADDGLDKTILDELKHIWLNKLKQSPALNLSFDKSNTNQVTVTTDQQFLHSLQQQQQRNNQSTTSNIKNDRTQFTQNHQQATCSTSMVVPLTRQSISNISIMQQQQQQNRATNISTTMSQIPRMNSNNVVLLTPQQQQRILAATASSSTTTNATNQTGSGGGGTILISNGSDPARVVAVQIMLPGNRIVHIQVPQIILAEKRLQGILTGTVIQSTMGMTAVQASNYLQQHINSSYQNQVRSMVLTRIINQLDGQFGDSDSESNSFQLKKIKKEKKLKHKDLLHKRLQEQDDDLNGTEDDDYDLTSSPSESDLSDDTNENDENNDSGESIIGIEESLNSDDDISDEECEDIFETENVIVCQYEKVIRNRNKWRFTFKDGIMNILGKDYVFNRTFGWGDW
ncbi:transcription initiation factor IIA subunit 1-like [Chrysoperla carnea]|uniref:transcription initiation factor IIA subunit 1-like n=1 Tax=Chrysoperla carnea TaxID=189513 RepID=UPI001D080F14|nr:transcription initiation factor IIA subunit 1-like [Chrysoperla carnea]